MFESFIISITKFAVKFKYTLLKNYYELPSQTIVFKDNINMIISFSVSDHIIDHNVVRIKLINFSISGFFLRLNT